MNCRATHINWNLKTSHQYIVETNGNKILLMNAPANSTQIIEIENRGVPLKKTYCGKVQSIYILDTLKYILPHSGKMQMAENVVGLDIEKFSVDRKFPGLNPEIFGPVNALSREHAHSGSHSIRLEKSNPNAVDYNLQGVKTGDLYQIEVWRKSDSSRGFLVIAAEDTKVFYNVQNQAIKYDNYGWELLRINVEINNELQGKNLKIYLWNPGKEPAYFDDLSIKTFSRNKEKFVS